MRLASLTLLTLSLSLAGACRHESALPRMFPVPDAALVSDSGKPVNLAEMKGYVTVYDFIFTNCAGTCPLMSHTMQQLTKQIDKGAPVRFVSISIDPTRDTPEVLSTYAKRLRHDDRWIFVTGQRKDIVHLSVDGFKLAAGDPTPGGDPLLHSGKFAVADRQGVIREYYNGAKDDSVEHVAATVKDLLREPG